MLLDAFVRPSSRTRRGISVPSVPHCALFIFMVKLALKHRGFGPTIRWIRGQVQGVPELPIENVDLVRATEQAVATAGALYPGRALCLEQSLVLYYTLRCQGVAAKFRMGIQAHPFVAHAWVEYAGGPVNDIPEHVKLFARLPDELP